ncbi:hypothetical protein Y1Q_0002784 [Alligator mississippiensis]|uniref:Uncharacterized protein n=1 Tax=Alligator mississippiensis TaxID=8496 RepID=A0A151P0J3_ALLMI|nr:hypothetical protein Y1Q_0002784 [Alligator mississippiensis]
MPPTGLEATQGAALEPQSSACSPPASASARARAQAGPGWERSTCWGSGESGIHVQTPVQRSWCLRITDSVPVQRVLSLQCPGKLLLVIFAWWCLPQQLLQYCLTSVSSPALLSILPLF